MLRDKIRLTCDLLLLAVLALVILSVVARAQTAPPAPTQGSVWFLVVPRTATVWITQSYTSERRCHEALKALKATLKLEARCAEVLAP